MNDKRKILIITYHYLPEVMAASYRMFAWAKYLQKLGWEPLIMTHESNESKSQKCHEKSSLFSKEHDKKINCLVYRVPHYRKFKKVWDLRGKFSAKNNPTLIDTIIRKFLSFVIRNLLLIPDEKAGWYEAAYKAALSIVKTHKIDIIVATGPPWTDFKIAAHLSRARNIPWIADYRDPWTQPTTKGIKKEYLIWFLLNRIYEQKLIKTAAAIIHITETLQKGLKKMLGSEVHLVRNGFDPDNFQKKKRFSPDKKIFTIAFIGTLHSNTTTDVLMGGFHRFVKESSITPATCKLELIGDTNGYKRIEKTYKKFFEINNFVSYRPPVSQKKANEKMCRSHVLLLFPFDMRGCVPAKTYEYLASERPILVTPAGKYQEEIRRVIAKTRSGIILNCRDEVADWLKTKYEEFISTGCVGSFTNWPEVKKYSREYQVQKVAKILKREIEMHKSSFYRSVYPPVNQKL